MGSRSLAKRGSFINRFVVAYIETYISIVANSLFIDCGCAVRRFCPNMSLQQVHARQFNYMVHGLSLAEPC